MSAARAAELDVPMVCRRCKGSGTIVLPGSYAGVYDEEDSTPRELPLQQCPECGGTGGTIPKGRRS